MRRIYIFIVLVLFLATPVSAMEFTAPTVPESAEPYMPKEVETFSEGLWYIMKSAIAVIEPALAEGGKVCLSLIAVNLLLSLVASIPEKAKFTTKIIGVLSIGLLLLRSSNSMIQLGIETIEELSEYGKLLLPVLTSAMAAQGGTTSSVALYTGTVIFDTVLSTAIVKLLVPMLYLYICLSVAKSALSDDLLKKIQDFIKWLITWGLKISLYVFTGYMGITGVVSGTTDAAVLKAAKLTISGVVPVVGNILSDASEAVVVSAGVMKNAVGIYGLLAIVAVWIGPFLQTGIQYLLLKLTCAVCGICGSKECVDLIADFSGAMGLLLAMTGTLCLLLLISTVCFLKGVG